MGLDPVPRADQPEDLIIGSAGVPVIVAGGIPGEQAQRRAAGRGIQRSAGANPAARLAYSPGNDCADPGIPGPRRPTIASPQPSPRSHPTRAATEAARTWSAVASRASAISAATPGVIQARRRGAVRILLLAGAAGILIVQVCPVLHPLRPVR